MFFHSDARGLPTSRDKEKETSSTPLFSLSGIILLLGAAVSVIAGVMTLFLDNSQSAAPTTIQSPLWSTFWCLAFVGIVLILRHIPLSERP